MISGTFIIEIKKKRQIEIPPEIADHLHLQEGDKLEVMIKKIRSRRLDIKISKNPLVKLLEMSEENTKQ